jgi:hypothetical protein
VASLAVEGDRLVLRLSITERVFGLVAGDLESPLSSVRAAYVVRPARSAIRGFRAPGAGMPGLLALGHWRGKSYHDFVAVYGSHAGVAVELDGERFDRWIVSVDDPEAVVTEIEKGGVSRPSDRVS